MTPKPIYLSKIQMRLAVELAAQTACQVEYKRQIESQTHGLTVIITGAEMDIKMEWPVFEVQGRQVEWTE